MKPNRSSELDNTATEASAKNHKGANMPTGAQANLDKPDCAVNAGLKGKRVFTEPKTRSAHHCSEISKQSIESLAGEKLLSGEKAKLEPKRTFDPRTNNFAEDETSSSSFYGSEGDADEMMQGQIWQSIVEQQSLTSEQADDIGLVGNNAKKRSKSLGLLGRLTLLSFTALIMTELGLSLYGAWQTSPLLFALYTTVISLGGTWLVSRVWQEVKLLRKLKQQSEIQADTARLQQSMQMGEAEKLINRMTAKLAPIKTEAYYRATNEQHNDTEKLMLYEQTVLSHQDDEAKKVVSRFAAESSLLLAASPLAVLDMGIILWRNQAMISRIADIYGIELGYWSRIKLIRGVITNILYAGTSELVADLGTQMLSVEMSGKLSARLAQGLGGGLLTARLGYQAMAFCRPIGFTTESKPKLSKIHQELLSELKSFSLGALSKRRNKEFTSIDK